MNELKTVFAEYLQTKNKFDRVPPNVQIPALAETIRRSIPNIFRAYVQSSGHPLHEWHVKGSFGEPNRTFAHVPWVALFKRSITTSALEGYYIVLLFSEDMSSVHLTLNQGFTEFQKHYKSKPLIYKKLRDCAAAAISEIGSIPHNFNVGPINLRTSGDLAKGYEVGSILSRSYSVEALPSQSDLEGDVHTLINAYSTLWAKFPNSLVLAEPSISNDDFTKIVERQLKIVPKEPSTIGPQRRPQTVTSAGRSTYVRSTDVTSRAIAMADFVCALSKAENPHPSFISKRTGKRYVEAHHLIPFSKQSDFENSLDVEENIVTLCANCHRLLHHAHLGEKQIPLRDLWKDRKDKLVERGINVELDKLKKMYGELTDTD